MDDLRLRPRLLRSLLRDRIPDEKLPAPPPSDITVVISQLKTYSLLSEVAPSVNTKLTAAWKSAVDAWVDRIITLVESNTPDKTWMGVSLLGVTCEQCCSERFLASYATWFQKLFRHFQAPSSSHFVKVASCVSIADLFTRLSSFPNVKKDATSLAGKVVQPLLELLKEDASESVLENELHLVCILIKFFSMSVHRHYDNVEAVLVSKIMSGKCSTSISKKLAQCLALLPKAKGDGDSWSVMMQKVLILINELINDAFQGLEDESKKSEVVKLLIPPGRDPPSPLGGYVITDQEAQRTVKSLREFLVPRVSTLMYSSSMMLTLPYHVQLAVPVSLLLALVGRVLLVDGSVHGRMQQLTTSLHQELICSMLPSLHISTLDLLIATIKRVRSQLLPHAANIARLLMEYFKRTALPSIRSKVYSIIQILLVSMGAGMALFLGQDVVDNAFADLQEHSGSAQEHSSHAHTSPVACSSKVAVDASSKSCKRKRKHAFASMDQLKVDDVARRRSITPLSVKIGALRTLQALLAVGGSLRSEQWRSNIDSLIISVAIKACSDGWANEENTGIIAEDPSSSLADFQLASLEALLVSLLSTAHFRPSYLSQGLELFRRGKQEIGTKISSFCTSALLALEVLIHPRALPLTCDPNSKRSAFDEKHSSWNQENTFQVGQRTKNQDILNHGLGVDFNSEEDEIYRSWQSNGEDVNLDGETDQPVENCEESARPNGVVKCEAENHDQLGPNEVEMEDQPQDVENFDKEKSIDSPSREESRKDGVVDETSKEQRSLSRISEVTTDAPELTIIEYNTSSITNDLPTKDGDKGKAIQLYNSDLESIDSLQDIVDADPDSDSDSE